MKSCELIAHSRRVVVKVGSGVLTLETGLDRKRVEHLADQISRLATGERQVVLVSSGAVASGRVKAGLKEGQLLSLRDKQAAAALGQAGLVQAYEESFAAHGRQAAQVLLTASDLTDRRRWENARNTFTTLLDWGVIPVVNENDTVSVAELKLGDNDNLAAMLTNLLGADLMINLTNVDGILDSDPRTNPNPRRIPLVERVETALLKAASSQPGAQGAGGIVSKVRAADKVARSGAATIVANGLVDGILDRLAAGEDLGTLFSPRAVRLSGRKHWIAFAAAKTGEVVINEGAVKPLVEDGRSLLAAGVLEVRGPFSHGAAVRVLGPGDCIIGVGLCNYDSHQLDVIKGKRSSQIDNTENRKNPGEVIHRDNLVVFRLDEEEALACLLNQ